MEISPENAQGARKFVDFVTENMTGFTDDYQKFLDLVDHINRKMLIKFEDSVQEYMEKMRVGLEKENDKPMAGQKEAYDS